MISRVEDLLQCYKLEGKRLRIVVAGAEDANALETICDAWKLGIIDATLAGSKEVITAVAEDASLDLTPFEIVDIPEAAACIEESIRRISEGNGDILMKGHVATGDLMRKVLDRQYGFRIGRILSHVAVFTAPGQDRIMMITDAGINVSPDLVRKRDIILNAVDVAHVLGISCPKVAMLSFVEKAQYHSIRSITDATMLADMNRAGGIPGCIVEGPYALDNAVSPEAARIKNIQGQVVGCADILVAHDINMGNAIYKALQLWVKSVIAGVVVGAKTPIIVPSRADCKESKLQSIALALQLMKRKV